MTADQSVTCSWLRVIAYFSAQVLRQSKHSSYIALKAPQDSGLHNNVVELLKKVGGKVVELTDLEFRTRVSGDADLKRRRIDQQEQLSKGNLGLLEAAVRLRGDHGTDRQNLLASDRILRIADRLTAAQADGLRHKAQQVQAEQESSTGP